jgi:hypothetical protein
MRMTISPERVIQSGGGAEGGVRDEMNSRVPAGEFFNLAARAVRTFAVRNPGVPFETGGVLRGQIFEEGGDVRALVAAGNDDGDGHAPECAISLRLRRSRAA